MHPILLKISSFNISFLAIFMVFGFIVSAFTLYLKSKEEHIDEQKSFDWMFLIIFFSIIGSRLLFLLLSLKHEAISFWSFINFIDHPGFFYWGGVFLAVIATTIIIKKEKTNFFKFADTIIFSVVYFHLFTVAGLYFDNSYIGKTIEYTIGQNKYVFTHPILLYETVLILIMLFILHKVSQEYRTYSWYKYKKDEAKPGLTFLAFFLVYGLFRFALDFAKTGAVYLIMPDMLISLFVVFISGSFILIRSGRLENQQILITGKLKGLTAFLPVSSKKKFPARKYKIKAGKDVK